MPFRFRSGSGFWNIPVTSFVLFNCIEIFRLMISFWYQFFAKVIRFRSGFCSVPVPVLHPWSTHSFLLNRLPPPQCDQCNTRLSVKHLLLECTKYMTHRSTIFESNTELAQILGDNSNLRNLFNYINKTFILTIYNYSFWSFIRIITSLFKEFTIFSCN